MIEVNPETTSVSGTAATAGTQLALGSDLPPALNIREVGPRDGLQIEAPITTEAKLDLIAALVATGVRRIEATAFVSRSKVPAMADAEEIASEVRRWPEVEWTALVAGVGGMERALAAGMEGIEYVVSASDGHSRANAGRDTAQATDLIGALARSAQAAGVRFEVIVATAWDCPFDGPVHPERVQRVVDAAVDAGADRVCLADTIGTAAPGRVAKLLASFQSRHPELVPGIHMHDTRGMGLASILTAMTMGVTEVDASIAGLGGCPFAPGASGNVATEDLAYMCRDSGVATGLGLEQLLDAAALAQRLVGRVLPSNLLRAGDRNLG